MHRIPFNRPYLTGNELANIEKAHLNGRLAGNGTFTKRCAAWLESATGARKVLLTHSCTAALEMTALLADIKPGDEVIMPSYTFVSTANAFVLRGAVPVFVDIRPDTLNIDETLVEPAITPKTRAIVPVHYAGVGCNMTAIMAIAERHGLLVIEDAAQGILASHQGRPLGSIGHMATFSFHETKNIISGEGGALVINDPAFVERAEILWEKGTNRNQFFRGIVDKYTWHDVGSSFLPGEVIAAFLSAQLDEARAITDRRLTIWARYHAAFAGLEQKDLLTRPQITGDCIGNGHLYYLLVPSCEQREQFIRHMANAGIQCVSHYEPLHAAPFGRRCARASSPMTYTEDLAQRLVRLPLWLGLEKHLDSVIDHVIKTIVHMPTTQTVDTQNSRR